jgi:hypothetical protein
VDRATPLTFPTDNVANSWIAVDLGSGHSAVLNKYSLQHKSASNGYIRTWKLQGSNNPASNSVADLAAATWTDLDTQTSNGTIGAGAGWVSPALGSTPAAYRWFRVIQTGANTSGSNVLNVGEVELYGTLTYSRAKTWATRTTSISGRPAIRAARS